MPFKDAVFWIGLTMFANGLYFLFDWDKRRRLRTIASTIIGAVAIAYSVYAHYHPEVSLPTPLWVYLLLLTWALISYDIYARKRAKHSAAQRLTVRIIRGFVARQQNEWSTMLLLLEVKVDGPPAEVTKWKLHLKYETAAKAAFHIPIDPAKMRLEYCPAGDRNVYRADPIPKAAPDRGWILFSVLQAPDELFDHVFGGTFVLNAVEHNGEISTLKQPPDFWLHRADIIQWSELRD